MNTDIRAIYLDLGNTFRIIHPDEAYQRDAKEKIAALCGAEGDGVKFFDEVIEKRYGVYREWALKYMCEAPEKVLWTRWLAYDFPRGRILENSAELTYQYRRTKGERRVVDGGVETVRELGRRGYTVGIISDLVGTREVDEWLDRDGIRSLFATVQQSSITLLRKPHPAIYYYAAAATGIEPENSAYIGDNLNRDIVGAKQSLYGLTVAAAYPFLPPLKLTDENRPDCKITAFPQLLELFPARGSVNTAAMQAP